MKGNERKGTEQKRTERKGKKKTEMEEIRFAMQVTYKIE